MLEKYTKPSVFSITLVLTFLFICLAFMSDQTPGLLPLLSDISNKATIDTKFRFRKERPLKNDILIVTIDDKSIAQLGRWPWKRSLIAAGLRKLAEGSPRVIALDIVFSEPDTQSPSTLLRDLKKSYEKTHAPDFFSKRLEKEATLSDTDKILSEAIKTINQTTPVLLGYFFYFDQKDIEGINTNWEAQFKHIFHSKITAKISTVENPTEDIPEGIAALSSHREYALATPHHGFFDLSSDPDGTIRSTHLIGKYKDTLFPSFALKTVALAQDKDITVKFGPAGIENIYLDITPIPTNAQGKLWINYLGPSKSFPSVSFSDVILGDIEPDIFKDRVILIGVTAKAVADVRVSPLDSAHPGTEINATIVENLLHNSMLRRPSYMVFLEMLFILLMGLALASFFQRWKAVQATGVTLTLLILYFLGDYLLFFKQGLLANSFIPSCHLFLVFVSSMAYKYFIEERKSREIKNAFERYVSPEVVGEILKDPSQLTLGGEKRWLTVLFSDIRGFTSISEQLNPDDITHLLNIYLSAMTQIVYEHQGMLDKYVGDELMAVYGAPLKTEHHTLDACRTAIAMIQKLETVRKEWSQHGVEDLNIGIGIHTGDMIVGNMGSEKIFDYTVIGDAVNLGSRLQGINKIYGTQIIVSETVYQQIHEQIACRELDDIRVRGLKRSVKIYELLTASSRKEDLQAYGEGLALYRERKWKEASQHFQKLADHDAPSKTLLQRCKQFKEKPPAENWDGVIDV